MSRSNTNSPMYNHDNDGGGGGGSRGGGGGMLYNANAGGGGAAAVVEPRKLELILNEEDGSLQTSSLLNVVLSTTDSLYKDIYNMSNGEIMVTNIANKASSSSAAAADDQEQNEFDPSAASAATNQATTTTSAKSMASLNFAQRRHEASWRLASHQRAVANVAALAASSSGGGGQTGGAGPAGIGATLGQTTSVSTKALQHARKAWVSADVAQDSLFFSHANLFPSRAPPHDVYGACDTMIGQTKQARNGEEQAPPPSHPIPPPGWYDLPSDLRLVTDRYDTSKEKQLTTEQVATQWHMAVRRKLLLGEVGWMKQKQLHLQQQIQQHELPLLAPSGVSDVSMAVEVPWKVSLRGGIVRLTHGVPKITPSKAIYPIEAVLTVLSPTTNIDIENNNDGDDVNSSTKNKNKDDLLTKTKTKATLEAEWTLVNVDVHVQAKTGQSNHQLDTTNKQRYNLHKMCSLAMSREEARARKLQLQHDNNNKQAEADGGMNTQECSLPPARPLHAVFQVAQYFSLSWQLEILSSQALTLRKGLWSGPASESTTSSSKGGSSSAKRKSSKNDRSATTSTSSSTLLNVTPVQFFENRSIIGIMSISFWSVDDRYGPPALGDLDVDPSSKSDDKHHNHNHNHNDATTIETKSTSGDTSISTVSRSLTEPPVSNQLTLSIRAEPSHHHGSGGIRVSLSGGGSVMEFAESNDGDDEDAESSSSTSFHIRETIRELLDATSNPFHLSASEALLAATKLCAERKCYAVVEVLPQYLPSWIVLKVERGSILVAAKAHYDTSKGSNGSTVVSDDDSRPVVLFRLACDTRTGSFISTFSRSTQLLQYLACNDIRAGSDTTLLRAAAQAASKKKPSSSSSSSSTFTAGRAVRDAFDSLIRSMNVLGQRVGVGIDTWKDQDDMSALLRRRSIQSASADVKVSLMTCCGMAALYGMAATAVGVATGVQPGADIAGGKIEPNEIEQFQQHQHQLTAAASPASSDSKSGLIPTPPLGVLIDQKIVEENIPGNIDSRLKQSHASQAIFGMCCSVDETNGLTIHPANITVRFISPSSPVLPTRTNLIWTKFASVVAQNPSSQQNVTDKNDETTQEPSTKRLRMTENKGGAPPTSADKINDLMVEVERFATIISKTIFSS